MINKDLFLKITKNVNELINNSFNQLYLDYPEEYVLFLASGEYDEIIARNNSLNISPYTISGHNIDNYYDFTRENFLCEFMNLNYDFSEITEIQDNKFRINVEFLIYTHIWEAKPFLKRLYRLGNLLCGSEYDWKVQIPLYNKSHFIKNEIIKPFNTTNTHLGLILENNYNTDLRNAIAHSDYQLDFESKTITFNSKNGISNISFDDWSILFTYSFSLSYYFSHIFAEKRKYIIKDWGKNYFTIKMPFSDGTIKHACIQYETDRDEFGFIFN